MTSFDLGTIKLSWTGAAGMLCSLARRNMVDITTRLSVNIRCPQFHGILGATLVPHWPSSGCRSIVFSRTKRTGYFLLSMVQPSSLYLFAKAFLRSGDHLVIRERCRKKR